MSTLTEEDFADIELAASKAMREWERGYYCQDINVRHHISWWIMQETARRVAATRPIVAEQQGGGDVLMAINVLMHNWRCGRYKSTYVLSRLSQMFPSEPSVAARRGK